VVAVSLAFAGTAAAVPPAPGGFGAFPRYGTPPQITVRWNEVVGATRYEIHRSVNGGASSHLETVTPVDPTAQRIYEDKSVSTDSTYTYRVEACDASGCANTETFTTSFQVVWPIAGGHEVLHGHNEIIAWAGVQGGVPETKGYHDGVDLNRTSDLGEPGDDVLAPRGGIVIELNVTPPSPDNGFIAVAVDVGTGFPEYDSFNHIATSAGNLPPVAVGDIVAPGQMIARIGTEHFPGRSTDHVHSMVTAGSFANTSLRHFLSIFTAAEDRDPQGHPPALFDENQDGRSVLFRRHGQLSLLEYDAATKPLEGDVDIAVEVTDQQGTDPRQAPIDLGYWIEGPLPAAAGLDDVRSAESPYRLYDYRGSSFGFLRACSDIVLLNPEANAGCRNIDGLGSLGCSHVSSASCDSVIITDPEHGGGPWIYPVLHHFLVTFAKGPAGATVDNADPSLYWRTDAEDDGRPVTDPGANYAGKPRTRRATTARFPDGYYTIHAVASDLVHDKVDLPIPNIRLENFTPYIRELRVAHDVDGLAATGVDGCELVVYHYTYPGMRAVYPGPNHLALSQRDVFARAGLPLCVRVRFSEPMDDALVSFIGERGAGSSIASATLEPLGTLQARDTWRARLELAPNDTGSSDSRLADDTRDAAIAVRAHDMVDRQGHRRTLDSDGDGSPNQEDDQRHLLKVDLSRPKKTVEVLKTR
jgi:hypothetical protein